MTADDGTQRACALLRSVLDEFHAESGVGDCPVMVSRLSRAHFAQRMSELATIERGLEK